MEMEHQQTSYTCPMHPEVIKAAPGRCPKCGMDLVRFEPTKKHEGHEGHHAAVTGHDAHLGHEGHSGYDKHAGHHTHDFLKRFWVCLVVTIPVLLLSHMIQTWLGFELRFPGDKYLLLILSTFIYLYGGMPFLKGMQGEIKAGAIGMMTLVAIAITVAFIYSAAVVLGLKGMDFFWELATLIDIMLLGHWLEMRSQMAASKALESLIALLPSKVHVEKESGVVDIDLKDLRNGD